MWAFLQSREQYETDLQEIHGLRFGESSGLEEDSGVEQLAQRGVGAGRYVSWGLVVGFEDL